MAEEVCPALRTVMELAHTALGLHILCVLLPTE